MTPFERIAANLRAIFTAHVALQFVDRSRPRPTDDIQRNGLVRIATKASNLKVEISGIECVSQRWRWLRRPLEADHALVPGHTGQPVGFLPRLFRAFSGCPDRTSIDRLSRFGAHSLSKRSAERCANDPMPWARNVTAPLRIVGVDKSAAQKWLERLLPAPIESGGGSRLWASCWIN
jgi:hypothetical protein